MVYTESMTTTHRTNNCRTCGATYSTGPRGNSTVNCPACRGPKAKVTKAAPAPYAPAPAGTTCTIGPNAVTGHRCGAPAAVILVGTPYAECAAHAPKGA